MSNARSPREVCSTTIGTSGLTVLASFRFESSNPSDGPEALATARGRSLAGSVATPHCGPDRSFRPGRERLRAGRPELARAGAGRFGAGRPQLVARLGLLDRDRLRGVGDQVQRLALGEVVAQRVEPPVGAQPLEQL